MLISSLDRLRQGRPIGKNINIAKSIQDQYAPDGRALLRCAVDGCLLPQQHEVTVVSKRVYRIPQMMHKLLYQGWAATPDSALVLSAVTPACVAHAAAKAAELDATTVVVVATVSSALDLPEVPEWDATQLSMTTSQVA